MKWKKGYIYIKHPQYLISFWLFGRPFYFWKTGYKKQRAYIHKSPEKVWDLYMKLLEESN